MSRRPDRSAGIAIFLACIVGFIVYAWLLLVSEWSETVLKFSVLAAVAGLLGVLAWIGLTMATARRAASTEQQQKKQKEEEEKQKQYDARVRGSSEESS